MKLFNLPAPPVWPFIRRLVIRRLVIRRLVIRRLVIRRLVIRRLVLVVSAAAVCATAVSVASLGTVQAQESARLFLNPGGHTSVVRQVLFTQDGQHLISVSDDKSIRVWDTVTGKQIGMPIYGRVGDDGQGKLLAAALDRSGKLLAVAGQTYVGDAGSDMTKNRFVIRVLHLGDVGTAAVSSQELLPHADDDSTKGHGDIILGLAFSPDGRQLASCSGDTTLRLWNVKEGSSILLGGKSLYDPDHHDYDNEHTDRVACLAWSPDGSQIASGSYDKTVRVWDAKSGSSLRKLDLKDRVHNLAWSPSAQDHTLLIGTLSDDEHAGTVVAWDLSSNHDKIVYRQDKPVSCLAYSADGQWVAVGQDTGAGGSHAVHLWPAGQIGDDAAGRSLSYDSAIQTVAFAPDGKTLASGTNNGDVFLWNLDPKLTSGASASRRLGGPGKPAAEIAWSADGNRLRWKSGGQTFIYTLDHASFQIKGASSQNDVTPGAWTGPRLVDGGGHILRVVDNSRAVAFSDKSDLTFPTTPSDIDFITSETVTPDNKSVIVGSNNSLRAFDSTSGHLQHQFTGHTAAVLSLAVSPDGKYLASASADQTVRIWSLRSGEQEIKPILSVFADSGANWVAWTPPGYYACSPSGQYLIGWQRNQGDGLADFDPASGFPILRQQDVITSLWKYDGDIQKTIAVIGAPDASVQGLLPTKITSLATTNDLPLTDGQQIAGERIPVTAKILPGNSVHLDVKLDCNNFHETKSLVLSPDPSLARQGVTVTWDNVPLLRGLKNVISVTALGSSEEHSSDNTSSTLANYTAVVTSTLPPPQPHTPRLHLVVIGVRRYLHFLDLLYPDKDAEAMAEAFEAQQGKLFSTVSVTRLINKGARRQNILDALDTLKTSELGDPTWDQYDYTIVFIAGHGGQTDDKHYYFLPYDVQTSSRAQVEATALDWNDIYRPLKQLPGRVIVFLDTCHSAGSKKSDEDTPATAQTNNSAYSDFLANLNRRDSSVITLASCDAGQTSQERDQFRHGAFAQALLEGLQAVGNPVHLSNGQVTLNELSNYVHQRVEIITAPTPSQESQEQVPPLPLGAITPEVSNWPLVQASGGQTAQR